MHHALRFKDKYIVQPIFLRSVTETCQRARLNRKKHKNYYLTNKIKELINTVTIYSIKSYPRENRFDYCQIVLDLHETFETFSPAELCIKRYLNQHSSYDTIVVARSSKSRQEKENISVIQEVAIGIVVPQPPMLPSKSFTDVDSSSSFIGRTTTTTTSASISRNDDLRLKRKLVVGHARPREWN